MSDSTCINLVVITSVVNPPDKPLSYSVTRSVYTRQERFQDTKKTFETVRKYIPNCKILLVECSDLYPEEQEYFQDNSDYLLNLWDKSDLHPSIFGISKALGEGTMTIEALNYILSNPIDYHNLFKISGRYWLNKQFCYNIFNNDQLVFKPIHNDLKNISTVLYKIPKHYTLKLLEFLIQHMGDMHACVGYEILFGYFLDTQHSTDIQYHEILGVSGKVTVVMELYHG
jgi:hypothetical protein